MGIAELSKHIHYEDDTNDQLLKKWWQLLGVSSEKDGAEQYRYLTNSFDLIKGVAGLNARKYGANQISQTACMGPDVAKCGTCTCDNAENASGASRLDRSKCESDCAGSFG